MFDHILQRRKFVVEPYDETGMKFVHFTESYKK